MVFSKLDFFAFEKIKDLNSSHKNLRLLSLCFPHIKAFDLGCFSSTLIIMEREMGKLLRDKKIWKMLEKFADRLCAHDTSRV